MEVLDSFTFFNGMSAGGYLIICLVCGLQQCFHSNKSKPSHNVILSRFLGITLLGLFCAGVCYVLSAAVPECLDLWQTGCAIDYLSLALTACIGYFLYSNNQPSTRILCVLALPFIILFILLIIKPLWIYYIFASAGIILISDYIFFSIALRRRERSIDDLYSNPESHSLKWLMAITGLLVGWLIVHCIFLIPELRVWHEMALYVYMTGFVVFATIKVERYDNPITREVQEQVENVKWSEISISSESVTPLHTELIRLLEEEKIFLQPDLTVYDVVTKLGTNTKYFSAMLHNEIHTTFCALINGYRIEHAKKLLTTTDDKVEHIGVLCGFNSRQSFYRSFSKVTGKTPVDWRKNH